MLQHTFIHIQGVGPKIEQGLWRRSIYRWKDFLNHGKPIFSSARDLMIRNELKASLEHLTNIRFFCDRLSSTNLWRIFSTFRDRAVYLDIETSGGYRGVDEITVIGLYDGHSVYTFVNGQNLEEFEIAIASYELVITFNGGSFDLPFIKRWFPNITLPPAHIDLRFFLNKLGYRGGLKSIEKQFGLRRDPDIDGMDGYDAVKLWNVYQWGDKGALEKLVRYNRADIVNLKPLMERGYEQMKKRLLPYL